MKRPRVQEPAQFFFRLRTLLLLAPVVFVAAGVFFAVRTALAGGDAAAVERQIAASPVFAAILLLAAGIAYLFFASRFGGTLHWRTILASVYLTAAVTGMLFTALDATLMQWLIPDLDPAVLADPLRRTVLGALEECLYGIGLGVLISVLDPLATRFTRVGIALYAFDYVLFASALSLVAYLNFASPLFDRFSSIASIIVILIMKAVIGWRNRRLALASEPYVARHKGV
ncbi:MAG: hypothetical protein IPK19_40955 [Chloroflexi bacterium]|nr:hypothetical protein [Chloroflexota bacterium]